MEDRASPGAGIGELRHQQAGVGGFGLLNGYYVGACLLTVLLSLPTVRYLYGSGQAPPLAAAWVVALLHGTAAFLINNRAIRLPSERFFIWGVGMNALRVLGLCALFLAAYRLYPDHFRPFIAASMIGYFCFLFGEVLNIQRLTGGT